VAAAAAPARASAPRWVGAAIAAVVVIIGVAVAWRQWQKSRPVALPAAAATAPSTADTLAERLAQELEETRKIAMDAEARARRAEQREQPTGPAVPSAHRGRVSVEVRGGAPRLLVDDKEAAATTPAIIQLPAGQHIVRVDDPTHQYVPRQIVIDVADGDSVHVDFVEQKLLLNRSPQMRQQLQTQLSSQGRADAAPSRGGFPSPPSAPTLDRAKVGVASRANSADSSAGGSSGAARGRFLSPFMRGTARIDPQSTHPYHLNEQTWQQMPPAEQEKATRQWSRMSAEQRQRAMLELRARFDSTMRARFARPPQQP